MGKHCPCVLLAVSLVSTLLISSNAAQCGRQAGGALCPRGLCCGQFGWCGNTAASCGEGCQSQCSGPTPFPPSGDGVASIITQFLFDQILKHRNDDDCPAKNFYTYGAFIKAASAFRGFGTTGDLDTRKREIAAFLAQTSHETTGGWDSAPDGPYAWGYCFKEEIEHADYCTPSAEWPCVPGRQYYGRGPIQLTHNYNYGPAGRAIGVDLLRNPDLVANNPVISFKVAIWFWMTPQDPKPSCHDVITGRWRPSGADQAAGRVPGYGLLTNIINGAQECGQGVDDRVEDRIGYYRQYCSILGVMYPGRNLDCYDQIPFGSTTNLKLPSNFSDV